MQHCDIVYRRGDDKTSPAGDGGGAAVVEEESIALGRRHGQCEADVTTGDKGERVGWHEHGKATG
jgi:hypothetical protein